MPELDRAAFASLWLSQAADQLQHSADRREGLSPEQLGHLAGKVREGLRILGELTTSAPATGEQS